MKRKITQRYLVVFTMSVLLIIVLWLGLSYLIIFWRGQVDNHSPKYMVHVMDKYINQETLEISDEGKAVLIQKNYWMQIVNKEGKVIYEFNTPDVIPVSYNTLTISQYILNSNVISGQTVFLSMLKNNKNYGILLGCDSSFMEKYNIHFYGGTRKQLLYSGIVLFILFIIAGTIAGCIFSRTMSTPIQDIIANINSLEADINLDNRDYKKNIFSSVYVSLQKLQDRLKSADRERVRVEQQKNKWISNISHDMRTPLSSIKGYAEVMMDDDYVISADERRVFLDVILKNSENIDALIQDLKFNRLSEDGKLVINKEEININKLIKECCDELPAEFAREKIVYCFTKSTIYISADRPLIKRCITNLISNAFVHNNGEVNVTIDSFRIDENIVIKISDDGKGLIAEEIDKIFDRYYRGNDSNRSAGSGLGLAIVKEIIEAHGGEIDVQSEKGKGTTFILKL